MKWGSSQGRKPAVVYRLFDADGALLYVGCTTDLRRRMMNHRCDRSWFSEVVELHTEPYPSRSEALRGERAAIDSEHPRHNVHPLEQGRRIAEATRRYRDEAHATNRPCGHVRCATCRALVGLPELRRKERR